jgi:hypothetical protein
VRKHWSDSRVRKTSEPVEDLEANSRDGSVASTLSRKSIPPFPEVGQTHGKLRSLLFVALASRARLDLERSGSFSSWTWSTGLA